MAHQWIICGGLGQGVGKSARDDTVPQAVVLVPMPAEKGEELGAPPDKRWGLWLWHLIENKLFNFTFILLILMTPVGPGQLEARVLGAVNTGETSQLPRAQRRVGKGGDEGPV